MQGNSWIGFFLRLPANLQDGLILSLSTGMEIIGQSFVRVDYGFLILKGRLAGTQDQGRIVVIPYEQLVYCAFGRKLTDDETAAIFTEPLMPMVFQQAETSSAGPVVMPAPIVSMPTTTMQMPAHAFPASVHVAPAATPAPVEEEPTVEDLNKPNMPSKAELLERLRTRLNEVGKK